MKKNFTLIIMLILIVFTQSTVNARVSRASFEDIEEHWRKFAIERLVYKNILHGMDDGKFHPDAHVTREQLALILSLALNLDDADVNYEQNFTDVKPSRWSFSAVEAVSRYMTYSESGDKKYFRPEEEATREEIVYALIKAASEKSKNLGDAKSTDLNAFIDFDELSKDVETEFKIAVKNKIINGKRDGNDLKLDPKTNVSRAEVAVMINNIEANTDIKIGREENARIFSEKNDKIEMKALDGKINLSIENVENALILTWDKAPETKDERNFIYYKILASRSNPNPIYPDDGYAKYYTDINTLSHKINLYDYYTKINNADLNKFESGEKYYIRVASVYEDKYYINSNVIETEIK